MLRRLRRLRRLWSAYKVIEQVYARIAVSEDVAALRLMDHPSLDVLQELPASNAVAIRHSLARMFLEYKYADRMRSYRIITRIRESRYASDEKRLLLRYALLLLWHYRRSSLTSPLLMLMHQQTFDRSKVRHSLLTKFGAELERAL